MNTIKERLAFFNFPESSEQSEQTVMGYPAQAVWIIGKIHIEIIRKRQEGDMFYMTYYDKHDKPVACFVAQELVDAKDWQLASDFINFMKRA